MGDSNRNEKLRLTVIFLSALMIFGLFSGEINFIKFRGTHIFLLIGLALTIIYAVTCFIEYKINYKSVSNVGALAVFILAFITGFIGFNIFSNRYIGALVSDFYGDHVSIIAIVSSKDPSNRRCKGKVTLVSSSLESTASFCLPQNTYEKFNVGDKVVLVGTISKFGFHLKSITGE